MGLQDLPFVVGSHITNFPHGFFARLGPRFLTRYYRTFLDGPLAVAIVSEVNGVPVGYLAGILDPRQHRRLLLTHHGFTLASAAAFGLASRPWLVANFMLTRLRRYVSGLSTARESSGPIDVPERIAVLSHLVVATDVRGQGIGASLVEEFVRLAEDAHCTRACLVTLAGTEGAGTFYRRRGWTHSHQRRSREGRDLDYYTCELQ